MNDPNHEISFPLLIRFRKAGLMRFTGHLDWQALEQAMFIKAGFRISVSVGPSKRLKLKTSPPTPVGVASDTELTYLNLSEALYPTEAMRRLRSVCPDGVRVLAVMDAALLPVKNPFGVIDACRYDLDLGDGLSEEKFQKVCDVLDEIKSGDIQDGTDADILKPFLGRILSWEIEGGHIKLLAMQEEGRTFHAAKCGAYIMDRLNLEHYPIFTKIDYYRMKPRQKKLFRY